MFAGTFQNLHLMALDPYDLALTKLERNFERDRNDVRYLARTWHDNRHTACSRWVMGGVPLAAVAKYVGHSTIQMTMRYSHLVPKVNQTAVDAMDAFYKGESEIQTDTRTDTSDHNGFQQACKLL